MIWTKIEDSLPECNQQHRTYYESPEVLLFCGDYTKVSRYFKRYTDDHSEIFDEGWENVYPEEAILIEQWSYIEWPEK